VRVPEQQQLAPMPENELQGGMAVEDAADDQA
jgi:hypothetical protein